MARSRRVRAEVGAESCAEGVEVSWGLVGGVGVGDGGGGAVSVGGWGQRSGPRYSGCASKKLEWSAFTMRFR